MAQPFAATLRTLRKNLGYSQADVTERLLQLGCPVNRFHVSRWENGYNRPTVEQFIGLCRIYGVKDVGQVFLGDGMPASELNEEGEKKLLEYKDLLIASGRYAPAAKHKTGKAVLPFVPRTVPLYDLGASAGTGHFLDSDRYEMIDVPSEVPEGVTFALHVCGNSMEPTLHDGELIWIKMQPELQNGDIGVFFLDGDAFVKEYRNGKDGTFLFSHNPDYAPIRVADYTESRIYGKVLYPQRTY